MPRKNKRQADPTLTFGTPPTIILGVTLETDGIDLIAHVECGSPVRTIATTDPFLTGQWRLLWIGPGGPLGAERTASGIEMDDSDPANSKKFVVRFAGVTTPATEGTWRLEWPWDQPLVRGLHGGVLGTVDDSASTYTPPGGISQMLSYSHLGNTPMDIGLMHFRGSTDCSTNPNYPAADQGDFYLVSAAGTIGGAAGTVVEAGDTYFASADNAGGTQAAVGESWDVIQRNIAFSAAGISLVTAADEAAMRVILQLADLATVVGGTGVATILANAANAAGGILTHGGPLGEPSSGLGTNITEIPPANITGTAAVLGANTFTALQNLPSLTVTGASTLAALSATTGVYSSTGSFGGLLTTTGGIKASGGAEPAIGTPGSTGRFGLVYASGLDSSSAAGGLALRCDTGIFTLRTGAGVVTALMQQGATRFGAAASATPLANTLTIGESSRPGIDTNTPGAPATIASGTGTGSSAGSSVLIKTPTPVTSGTGTQTLTTRVDISALRASYTVPVRLPNYTVANLPAGSIGENAIVTDATLGVIAGLGLTPVGGGTNVVCVFHNGAAWISD